MHHEPVARSDAYCDRAVGALLGTATGDALASLYEFEELGQVCTAWKFFGIAMIELPAYRRTPTSTLVLESDSGTGSLGLEDQRVSAGAVPAGDVGPVVELGDIEAWLVSSAHPHELGDGIVHLPGQAGSVGIGNGHAFPFPSK